MTWLANTLGRVMMTAVRLPRSQREKYISMHTFAEIEYGKDKDYVLDCLIHNRKIDVA